MKQQSLQDQADQDLICLIKIGIPDEKSAMPDNIKHFWDQRQHLYVTDGVVIIKHCIAIPQSLHKGVLESLHAAHQGISAMNKRARQSVYWPGITNDIQCTRDTYIHCNRITPTQPCLPPFEHHILTTPFEAICSNYFF